MHWNNKPQNDFTKVKIFKLLFLTVAASCNKEKDGLLTEFDNFWAFPYGPVELDIYNTIQDLQKYKFDNNGILEIDSSPIIIPQEVKNKIDLALDQLMLINPDLINYEAFRLVDLTHLWNSWSFSYEFALSLGKRSFKMPNELIKADNKIFMLDKNGVYSTN